MGQAGEESLRYGCTGTAREYGGEPDTNQRAKKPECPEPLLRARQQKVRESTGTEDGKAIFPELFQ